MDRCDHSESDQGLLYCTWLISPTIPIKNNTYLEVMAPAVILVILCVFFWGEFELHDMFHWCLQALVEKPSSGDKKTYRYLLIEEDKASLGKIF